MILCDTDILIEFYKNTPRIIQELRHIGEKQLAISVITQAELYFGALNKAELTKIKRHITTMSCLPLDTSTSQKFLDLMETYVLSHKLCLPDAIIAATALVHNLKLYTLNTKDFRFIAGIRLYETVSY